VYCVLLVRTRGNAIESSNKKTKTKKKKKRKDEKRFHKSKGSI
jgi:hypothetical protein